MLKTVRLLFFILSVAVASYASIQIFEFEKNKQELKSDLIELANIKYGLFNADEWKVFLTDILIKKVEHFELKDINRKELDIRLSTFLFKAIDEFEVRFHEENLKSVRGILKSGVVLSTGLFKQIKEDVPLFTKEIINFIDEKENKKAIKAFLIGKVNSYADSTYSEIDYSSIEAIHKRYGVEHTQEAKELLTHKIKEANKAVWPYKALILCIVLINVIVIALLKHFKSYEFLIASILSFLLLSLGVFLPMIEIDARISEMSFNLIGETISFNNQVLYYKSKSILEVVNLMLFQNRADVIGVGILVLSFSILFPISKLIGSIIYVFKRKSRTKKILNFIVFKSGKWSMADVMVIAIFMAYIGFDGIISEELNYIESVSESANLITTNQSSLLFGFFSFTSFVLLSLILSQKIEKF